jgi:hypothetical protein
MSQNLYDDGKYENIDRVWFGLTKKHGGACAAGFTFGTTDATKQTHVTRYYPKGPCKVIKFGARWLATAATASGETILARIIGPGPAITSMASVKIKNTATTVAPYTVASIESSDTTDFSLTAVGAGEYITIETATPTTTAGTAANTATTDGTVAFFVDIVPTYDVDKWNPDTKSYQA